MVLLNDVDFIVSGGLASPEQHAAVAARVRSKQALVLPALEPLEEAVGIKRGINQTLQAVRGETSVASSLPSSLSSRDSGPVGAACFLCLDSLSFAITFAASLMNCSGCTLHKSSLPIHDVWKTPLRGSSPAALAKRQGRGIIMPYCSKIVWLRSAVTWSDRHHVARCAPS